MTDKELLEYAAKAAGIDGKVRRTQGLYQTNYQLGVGKNRWNPLESDSDAFRLAVKLRISIFNNDVAAWVATGDRQLVRAEEEHGDDPYAATRRAITRAAAEIGKAKEQK